MPTLDPERHVLHQVTTLTTADRGTITHHHVALTLGASPADAFAARAGQLSLDGLPHAADAGDLTLTFEVPRHDGRYLSTVRYLAAFEGDLSEVDCPVCGEPVYANAPHSPTCPLALDVEG